MICDSKNWEIGKKKWLDKLQNFVKNIFLSSFTSVCLLL